MKSAKINNIFIFLLPWLIPLLCPKKRPENSNTDGGKLWRQKDPPKMLARWSKVCLLWDLDGPQGTLRWYLVITFVTNLWHSWSVGEAGVRTRDLAYCRRWRVVTTIAGKLLLLIVLSLGYTDVAEVLLCAGGWIAMFVWMDWKRNEKWWQSQVGISLLFWQCGVRTMYCFRWNYLAVLIREIVWFDWGLYVLDS